MCHLAVVEDEAKDQETLRGYFAKYAEEKSARLEVSYFGDAESFLSSFQLGLYDLVLMDIELQAKNGLEASKEMRAVDSDVVLVFMTNLAQYALEGYKVNAFDYLVKPISYFDFSLRLEKALERVGKRKKSKVLIFENGRKVVLPLNDIFYIEVYGHLLIYHAKEGNFRTYGTLKDISKELSSNGFSLCNSCFLVNLAYVKSVAGFTANVGPDELLISHPKRKSFLEELNRYLGG
jgi:Response regulator of the LytR/AlgR family